MCSVGAVSFRSTLQTVERGRWAMTQAVEAQSQGRGIGFGAAYALVGAIVGAATIVEFCSTAFQIGLVSSLSQVLDYYSRVVAAILDPLNRIVPVQQWMHNLADVLRGWRLPHHANLIDGLQNVQSLSLVCAGIGYRVVWRRLRSRFERFSKAVLFLAVGLSGFAIFYLSMPLMVFFRAGRAAEERAFLVPKEKWEKGRKDRTFAREFTALLLLSALAALTFFGINQVLQ